MHDRSVGSERGARAPRRRGHAAAREVRPHGRVRARADRAERPPPRANNPRPVRSGSVDKLRLSRFLAREGCREYRTFPRDTHRWRTTARILECLLFFHDVLYGNTFQTRAWWRRLLPTQEISITTLKPKQATIVLKGAIGGGGGARDRAALRALPISPIELQIAFALSASVELTEGTCLAIHRARVLARGHVQGRPLSSRATNALNIKLYVLEGSYENIAFH